MVIIDSQCLSRMSESDLIERLSPLDEADVAICFGPIAGDKQQILSDLNVQKLPETQWKDAIRLAITHAGESEKVSIISTNPIFLTALSKSDDIFVDNPGELEVYSKKNLLAKTGLNPEFVSDFLFLKGCPECEIPALAPISAHDAKGWIEQMGSLASVIRSKESPIHNHPLSKMILKKSQDQLKSLDRYQRFLRKEPKIEVDLKSKVKINSRNQNLGPVSGKITSLGQIKRFLSAHPNEPIAIALEGHKGKTDRNFAKQTTKITLCKENGLKAEIERSVFSGMEKKMTEVITSSLAERSGEVFTNNSKATYMLLGKEAFDNAELLIGDVRLLSHAIDNRRSQPTLESLLQTYEMKPSDNLSEDLFKVALALKEEAEKEPGVIDQFLEIEVPLDKILAEMEFDGIAINQRKLKENERKLKSYASEIKKKVEKIAGRSIDLGNKEDLKQLLFTDLKITPQKYTPGGNPSVSDGALELIEDQHSAIGLIREFGSINSLVVNGIGPLKANIDRATGRIHACFHQDLTATGRLSCSNPNLQAIPVNNTRSNYVREPIQEEKGKVLLKADYDQAEIYVLADQAGCSRLQNNLMSGNDIHRTTAAEIMGKDLKEVTDQERRAAKAINFGLIYGMSKYGLAKKLGVSNSVAQGYIEKYFDRYPVVEGYVECLKEHAREDNFVRTGTGRKIWLKKDGEQAPDSEIERKATNAPMQGTVADIVKKAMVRLHSELREKIKDNSAKIRLQVHDEIIVSCDEKDSEHVLDIIEETMSDPVIQFMPPVDIVKGRSLSKNENDIEFSDNDMEIA